MPDTLTSSNPNAADQASTWQYPRAARSEMSPFDTEAIVADAMAGLDEEYAALAPAPQETATARPIREGGGAVMPETFEAPEEQQEQLVNLVDTGRQFEYVHATKAILKAQESVDLAINGGVESVSARESYAREAASVAKALGASIAGTEGMRTHAERSQTQYGRAA